MPEVHVHVCYRTLDVLSGLKCIIFCPEKGANYFTGTSKKLIDMASKRGSLPRPLVLAGPSGSGKSTLLRKLLQDSPNEFGFSVSREFKNKNTCTIHVRVQYMYNTCTCTIHVHVHC